MEITPKPIENYCISHTTPLPSAFSRLRDETFSKTEFPQMQVGLIEGSLLKLLVALVQPRVVVELGTFTGYSSLAMAQALPQGAKIITCDINPDTTSIAQKYWKEAATGKKIELKLGPALETLNELTDTIDLSFIDADKINYSNYWDAIVPKTRKGGIIVVDNVLWSGNVLDPQSEEDHAIHRFNEKASKDPRVEVLMLPIRDGMLIARKI
jgi:caffeoyl-CoA O-methyltransferase